MRHLHYKRLTLGNAVSSACLSRLPNSRVVCCNLNSFNCVHTDGRADAWLAILLSARLYSTNMVRVVKATAPMTYRTRWKGVPPPPGIRASALLPRWVRRLAIYLQSTNSALLMNGGANQLADRPEDGVLTFRRSASASAISYE